MIRLEYSQAQNILTSLKINMCDAYNRSQMTSSQLKQKKKKKLCHQKTNRVSSGYEAALLYFYEKSKGCRCSLVSFSNSLQMLLDHGSFQNLHSKSTITMCVSVYPCIGCRYPALCELG